MVLITRARLRELLMLARSNGNSGHLFPQGSIQLTWSHALYQVLLSIHSGESVDHQWFSAAHAEQQIWQALTERLLAR